MGLSQTRDRFELTWAQLVEQVGRARVGLQRLGVQQGDRVAAYLPNIPETIVAFLATASLGATWTSCAPEFGVQAVLDRFTQVEPTVLLAVEGYRYGGEVSPGRRAGCDPGRLTEPAGDRRRAASRADVLGDVDGHVVQWDELVASAGELEFAQVAPEHPLYVLYSSGTTGLPKPIVHGHGGILLEHLKVLGLHADMRPSDRFFWFTTTGWMMWNYLVSGLLHGARWCCSTAIPATPDPTRCGASPPTRG